MLSKPGAIETAGGGTEAETGGSDAPEDPDAAAQAQKSAMAAIAEMWKDPKMRKAMEAQQLMTVKMMYADLFEDLGLSQKARAELSELLLAKTTQMPDDADTGTEKRMRIIKTAPDLSTQKGDQGRRRMGD